MKDVGDRRAFFAMAGAGALLVACRKEGRTELQSTAPSGSSGEGEHAGEQVGAVEDLMREHGVIRRALVVYRESAARLRAKPGAVPLDALQKAARLIRTFGEDYHERQLEEAHLFPAVRKAGGPAGALIDTLVMQHNRGREVTDFVLAVTAKAIGGNGSAEKLARALEGFARMYEAHAAQEDTVVFPAWKKTLTPTQLDETAQLFEDIEHRTFGKDGFDDAVDQVSAVERALGIDLAAMTPPQPAKG